jgi:serine/threonine protein kinase
MLGQVIDRYTLVEKLGSGGMGEVYKGHHAALDTYRAVKILPPHLSRNPELVERFLREAKRGAALLHPNIVRLEHLGEQDGLHYLVMDYITGRSLRQLIEDHGPLTAERAVRILVQVCRALTYAHQAGVVHRDVKPSNILVEESGRAVLTDFGIARWATSEDPALTAAGVTVGTPEYSAPEQIRGEPVDARSDLYSLGVVLYEAVTGEVPFRARLRNNIRRQQLDKTPDPPRYYNPSLPAALDQVILKALAKDPDDRFASAEELEHALREAVDLPAPQPTVTPNAIASEPITVAGTTTIGWLGGTSSEGPLPEREPAAVTPEPGPPAENSPVTPPRPARPAAEEPRPTVVAGVRPPAPESPEPSPLSRLHAWLKTRAATWPQAWADAWPQEWSAAGRRVANQWLALPPAVREQRIAVAAGVGLLVFVFVAVLSLDRLVSAGAAGRFTAEKGVDPKSGKEYGIVRAHGVPVIVLTQPSGRLTPAQRAVWTADRLERLLAGGGEALQPEQLEVMRDASGALVLARRAKDSTGDTPDPDDVIVTVDGATAAAYAGTNPTSLALWWRDVLRDQIRLARGRPPVFTYKTAYAAALDRVLQEVHPRRPGSWQPPGALRSAVKHLSPSQHQAVEEAWHTVPAAWRAGGPEPAGARTASLTASGERQVVRRENIAASDHVPGLPALAAIDGDAGTAWQSRQGPRYAGQRHWLKITVPPGARVSGVELQEGSRSNPRSQFRIKQVKATFSDGSVQRLWRQKPTDPLRLTRPARPTNWVKLEVEQVFANPRPRAAHLCVAEVRLWGPSNPALSVKR